MTSLLVTSAYSITNADELKWGENVGPVFAHVKRTDDASGLTVRASPSPQGKPLAHLVPGTEIRAYNEFKSGWVKIKSPIQKGWVNLEFVTASPAEGTVTKVDNSELCLPIRAGPASSFKKVDCTQIGEVLKLTGIMTSGNWLQLKDRRGWVEASSVQLPPEAIQGVEAKTKTPNVSSVTQANPSREKSVAAVPKLGSTVEKASVSKKAHARSTVTLPSVARSTAPPPKAAPIKQELPPMVCSGGWCVNFKSSEVTYNGKAVAGIECFKDGMCASIVGQHHAQKAAVDGFITFGNFKLLANGVILNSESGQMLVNCNAKGGIDHKCVASFLVKTVTGASAERKTGSVSPKVAASKEEIRKKAAKAPASPPLISTASTPPATPPLKVAPAKQELPHVACKGGWCVNFDSSQITHGGKSVPGIECFKSDVCTTIVAQHYVAQAAADGIVTFGKFKLLRDGAILDSGSTKLLAYCNGKGSIDQKCVANFLRKTAVDMKGKNATGFVSGKDEASREKIKKKPENSLESKELRSSVAAPKLSKNFDLNACYSKCPCPMGAQGACADCKQKCDDQYWQNFDEQSK
jgi:hypothetical protein